MNRHRSLALVIGGLAVSVWAGPAVASLITFEFAGEITSVRDDDGLLGGAVTIGTPFSGLYTFESTTADTSPYSPYAGIYPATRLVAGYVGDLPFSGITGSANLIIVADADPLFILPYDLYGTSWSVDFIGESAGAGINLVDNTRRALSRDSLPLLPPRLSGFDECTFGIGAGGEFPRLVVVGELTSLTPEPGTLGLVALGALLFRATLDTPRGHGSAGGRLAASGASRVREWSRIGVRR